MYENTGNNITSNFNDYFEISNRINTNLEQYNENIKKETTELNFFYLFGKKRRFPLYNDLRGALTTFILLLIGTFFYEKNLYSMISLLDKENNILYKKLMILTIITFIITLITFFYLSTSIPGYQIGEKISLEHYIEINPVKIINNKIFKLKYCSTCSIIKNLRTFHCKFCGICIERHDHHCGFISNCIGKNNLKLFFYFLFISFFHLLPICIFEFFIIVRLYHLKKIKVKENKDSDFNCFPVIILGGINLIFVCFFIFLITLMIISHIYLISINKTTNESVRKIDYEDIFNKGCLNNWKEVFCENN